MAHILVSGLINIETTVLVEAFPIPYAPVHYPFFGVNSSVSGVGYNVAKALTVLGDQVSFLSLIGQDLAAKQVKATLVDDHIPGEWVLERMAGTAQSVILYDRDGRRQIHVDLKDIQEQVYPLAVFEAAMADCDLLVLCNVNFSRPFLSLARRAGKTVATDVHTVARLDDEYNADFMAAADILFMSDEALPAPPERWARQVLDCYAPEILVIGLGDEGALLCVRRDNFFERIPATQSRPVINSIGAGDALFSAFIHSYLETRDPYLALEKAILFASYKIGATSAADGFLDHQGLERLYAATRP